MKCFEIFCLCRGEVGVPRVSKVGEESDFQGGGGGLSLISDGTLAKVPTEINYKHGTPSVYYP